VARIVNKGLLGDKMLDISKGESSEVVVPGGLIPSEDPEDILKMVDKMAGRADQTMQDLSSVASELANEELHEDIRESAHSINVMLKHITEGEGYPNRLLTDPAEAERISRVVNNLERTSAELSDTLTEVRLAVRGVRTGPGFAHDMLYGEGAKKEVAQIGNAAEEVAVTLRSIREGDGFARDVLFGGDGDTKDALANVTQLTADLRDIVRGVKQGKGTVGALLVDPSIYEDLKRVIGNVERNSVLRSLVRYSIKRDEQPAVKAEPKGE
jgi:phospholipid/cholesterol/gamma-HCH transport system substrate-binding protein